MSAEQPRSKLLPRVWLPLLGVALLGVYGAMFVPAFAGQAQAPISGISSTLWHALFFGLLWRWRQRKGWHGALLGAGVGLLAFMLAAFIGGMNRGA